MNRFYFKMRQTTFCAPDTHIHFALRRGAFR